jgi:hypothetical protein
MNSKAEYDLSRSRRAKDVPHLKKLQEAAGSGKTRISMLDDAMIAAFRARAAAGGAGCQAGINRASREALQDGGAPVMLEALRKLIREELRSD